MVGISDHIGAFETMLADANELGTSLLHRLSYVFFHSLIVMIRAESLKTPESSHETPANVDPSEEIAAIEHALSRAKIIRSQPLNPPNRPFSLKIPFPSLTQPPAHLRPKSESKRASVSVDATHTRILESTAKSLLSYEDGELFCAKILTLVFTIIQYHTRTWHC